MKYLPKPNRTTKQCVEVIRIFLANTSIRGFSRIIKTESTFLRCLWILFVISTITFLIVSIFKVFIDYRQYSVNIQTYIQIDNATPFPAITFCNHQPFSEKAYQLWESSKVMSPTKFNELFRSAAMKQFKNLLKIKMSVREADFNNPLYLATMNDRLPVYYQNLPSEITEELGHNISMIKICFWSYDQNMAFNNNCKDTMLVVKKISHPLYFNCFTVEPTIEKAPFLSRLGMIIWLGPDEQTNIKHRQGFLLDIFEQAYGLRVVIHEPGSYPKIESQGVQIEPGRLNELNYQPELNVKVDTERKPCINNPQTTYRDLDNEFKYDIDLCFDKELQEILMKECKCIFGNYPRFVYPNENIPYCGYVDPDKYHDFLKRKKCVKERFEKAADIKSNLKATKKCIHRCTSIEYSTTTSVTKWRPTDWQIYWLKELLDIWEKFMNLTSDFQNTNYVNISSENLLLYSNLTNQIEAFFTKKNLSDYIAESEKLTFNERYTFIVVKRKANNTFIKEERLVLSFNALVSRIGGLCSLYIGLTFAFFIELIDFLYTIIFLRNKFLPEQTSLSENHEGNQGNSQKKFGKPLIEHDEKLQGLNTGNIYWNVSTKCGVPDKKISHEDDVDCKSSSYSNLSNPWIPISETQ